MARKPDTPPEALRTLAGRYDASVFDPQRNVRVRLAVRDGDAWDARLAGGDLMLEPAGNAEPDATLTADAATWAEIAADVRGGMTAFQRGKLRVRRDLHLGVGLLAATGGAADGRLRFATVRTRCGRISTLEAGTGKPVIAIHGLGATKASMLPTVAAMAGDRFRVIALDLPGFGDSDKPLGAPYDPRFFARAAIALLDALEIDRAHFVGNSLGGRVALEVALHAPERVDRLGLLAPSLAWRRQRPWAKALKLVRPELGFIQPAPRSVVEAIVERVVPGGSDGWAAAGVDEFMRAYLTRRGRAAFYSAARQIYLEEPDGKRGFWTRLRELERPALFIWGKEDSIVPIGFERHVSEAAPDAEHLELDCGHVPQLECPRETHEALERFFTRSRASRGGASRQREPAAP
jgi:pimeloyl-ACP methyl ester carboxylesterase